MNNRSDFTARMNRARAREEAEDRWTARYAIAFFIIAGGARVLGMPWLAVALATMNLLLIAIATELLGGIVRSRRP